MFTKKRSTKSETNQIINCTKLYGYWPYIYCIQKTFWVIAIQEHLYIWIRCSKGASIKINMNRKKDNKPVNFNSGLRDRWFHIIGCSWAENGKHFLFPILELNSLYLSNFVIRISRNCLFRRWYWTISYINMIEHFVWYIESQ